MSRTSSRVALLEEFLRRSALWANRLGRREEWPFFDIAAAVDPTVRADDSLMEVMVTRLQGLGFSPPVRQSLFASVQWAALHDAGRVPADVGEDMADPFEPLLLVFERGGEFGRAHGRFEIDMSTLPYQDYDRLLTAPRMTSLSLAALDALDDVTRRG